MGFSYQMIASGTLLLSLLISGWLIRKKRPWLGYLLGILPIFAFWLFIFMHVPSRAYCQQNPGACEWAGIGLLMYTGLSIILLVFYTILSIVMVILSKRVISTSKINEKYTALLGIVLLTLTSSLGAYGGKFILQSGIFVRWQNLGNPPEPNITRRPPDELAIKIEAYNSDDVQIITNYGRRFRTGWEFCLDKHRLSENCWIFGQEGLAQGELQSCELQFLLPLPPGEVIDRAQTKWCNAVYTIQADYVILDDGTVWVWHYKVRTDLLNTIIIAIIPGMITGLLIGVIVLVFITKSRGDDSTQLETTLSTANPNLH